MIKIACVEDDLQLANEIKIALTKYHYEVTLIDVFDDITNQVIALNPHLLILDINLPNFNGYHWCQEIRKTSNLPILFISSKDERMAQVMAMTIGGDDYLTKPIDLELLQVKIQAMIRRTYDYSQATITHQLEVNGLILDISTLNLIYLGESIELTKNEFIIMRKLVENQGSYIHREKLMGYLWDNDSFIDDNALNVNLSRLRKKIIDLCNEDRIETKRGVGYRVQ